jgi:CRISPR-associated protein Cas2
MLMVVLERTPAALKGELSRWLTELSDRVLVGKVSALVRDALIERCRRSIGQGGAAILYSAPTEQGFRIRVVGNLRRRLVDMDGLFFMSRRRTDPVPTTADEDEPPF